jgi:hypothetical protein
MVRRIFQNNPFVILIVFSLAPDYILCSKRMESRLIPEIIKNWRSFYTDDPLTSESYCHIVNERHFDRVRKLIDPSKVVHGGETNATHNYISPTIMYVRFFLFSIDNFRYLQDQCRRNRSSDARRNLRTSSSFRYSEQ